MFPASNLLFIERIISRCLIRHFCSPYFSLLASRLLSVICTTPKLSNLSCENNKNYDLDEETVTTEAILPDDKQQNGYRSNIVLEKEMTQATEEANDREKRSTDGESRFLRSTLCCPITLSERAVQLKLAREVHGKRRSKKNLEGLYVVLATGPNIIKVSPTTSTIKEPGKAIVNSQKDIAKLGTQQERKPPLKTSADQRGPRTSEKMLGEEDQGHIKEFTRKLKSDIKVKHKRHDFHRLGQRCFIFYTQHRTRDAGSHPQNS